MLSRILLLSLLIGGLIYSLFVGSSNTITVNNNSPKDIETLNRGETDMHYFATSSKLNINQDVPEKKGFKLTNLAIPLSEIKDGGPPRDGIPSIDAPSFLTASRQNFLDKHEDVLGVKYNGVIKAYPIKILDRHEIVNDMFNDHPVVVSYCPLCGSGLSFNAIVDGKKKTFGVSGLLYNSDVLLYDRQTESLWSQIMMQAVSGPESGKPLEYIYTQRTTWGEWKNKHPETLLLSTNTGYNRNYDRKPYGNYDESASLYFPVANLNQKFHNKEWVIGVEVNGHYKAYPYSELRKNNGTIKDDFKGEEIIIKYNKLNNTAKLINENIKGATMFWFAWYAFHPETELYYH